MFGSAGCVHVAPSVAEGGGVAREGKAVLRRRALLVVGIRGWCVAVVVAVSMVAVASASASNAKVMAWGANNDGQLGDGTTSGPETCSGFACSNVPVAVSLGLPPGVRVTAVAAGGSVSQPNDFNLALLSDGTVRAWGNNEEGGFHYGAGDLGDGTETSSDVPVGVCEVGWTSGACPSGHYLTGVTAIAAGAGFGLALRSDGTVVAWGRNFNGGLGDGTTTNSDVPVPVCEVGATAPCTAGNGNLLKGVTAISAGEEYGMALLSNYTVRDWGVNVYGDLGNDTSSTGSDVPVGVCEVGWTSGACNSGNYLTGVTAVSAGGYDSLVLLSSGSAVAWGANEDGQLGDGTDTGPEGCYLYNYVCSKTPVAVDLPLGAAATAVSAGGKDSVALLSNETLMTWGGNLEGQLGNNTTTNSDVPVGVCEVGWTSGACNSGNYLTGVTAVSANGGGDYDSGHHNLALLNNATVTSWGSNYLGQLGTGNLIVDAEVPVAVSGLNALGLKVLAVSAGASDSLALVEPPPADPPEVGRCVAVPVHTGLYGSGSCTKASGVGDYEWEPGLLQPAFTTSSGSLTIASAVKAHTVKCAHETSDGDYSGRKTVGSVTLKLTGCTMGTEKCSSGGAALEEIVTEPLEGELGVEKLGGTNKIGLDLYPVGKTGPVIAFACGGTTVWIRGSVIVPVSKINIPESVFTLKAKASKGKQKPENFVGEPKDVLEESINSGPFEQTGLTATITLANSFQVGGPEINSVF